MFREIGPYEGAEVRAALKRVFNEPTTVALSKFLFPTWTPERFKSKFDSISTVDAFQTEMIAPAITSLINQTTSGVTLEGIENLAGRGRCFLYLSNHRDIVMDPALFVFKLHQHGVATPKVALGDNLLFSQWVTDLVKLNKSIIVRRNISGRELLRFSQVLSAYIRTQIAEERDSVWIAQREGRAKDGNDLTQASLLKMLAMGPKTEFLARLRALRVAPISISYEYDPCDALKARERLVRARTGTYAKRPGEDQLSILSGLQGHKGRVMIRVGNVLGDELDSLASLPAPEQAKAAAELIDARILQGYELWPSHFIAHDLLSRSTRFEARYDTVLRRRFEERLEAQMAQAAEDIASPEDRSALRELMLEMYANPVSNRLSRGLAI